MKYTLILCVIFLSSITLTAQIRPEFQFDLINRNGFVTFGEEKSDVHSYLVDSLGLIYYKSYADANRVQYIDTTNFSLITCSYMYSSIDNSERLFSAVETFRGSIEDVARKYEERKRDVEQQLGKGKRRNDTKTLKNTLEWMLTKNTGMVQISLDTSKKRMYYSVLKF